MPENVRFAPEKTSKPLELLLLPFKAKEPAPEFAIVSVPRSWRPAEVDEVPFTVKLPLEAVSVLPPLRRRPTRLVEMPFSVSAPVDVTLEKDC